MTTTAPVPSAPPTAMRRLVTVLVLVALVLAPGAFHLRRTRSAQAEARDLGREVAAGPRVRVATVATSPGVRQVALIGEARPWASVTLYAKIAGYLRTMTVDKGDRVRAGQVIAELESPEVDRALAGARVDHANKAAIAERLRTLVARKLVSPQEAEQAAADAAVAAERLAAAQAEQAYESLRAPFDGTVTARFADPGALLQSASSNQVAALPVATLAQVDRLRITVFLDQADAVVLRPGARATITMAERPGVERTGTVARVAGALDPRTRKMLAEIDLPNGDGAILAGATVTVTLALPVPRTPQVPAEAVVLRDGHPAVAVIGADSVAHFRRVTTGLTDGATIAVTDGLAAGQRVGVNVGDLGDGARVRPVEAP